MALWWQRLRQDVGPQFIKFLLVKIPLTILTLISLRVIRTELAGAFWAPLANSLLAQSIEFMLLRNRVFKNGGPIKRQIIIFWAWASLMAIVEGGTMSFLEPKFVDWKTPVIGPYTTGFLITYFIGHIPSVILRFYGDRKYVFPKHNASSSE